MIVTDTHCIRLVNRIGLVDGIKEPKKVEMALWKIHSPQEGSDFYPGFVFHGLGMCMQQGQKPYCEKCCLADICKKNGFHKKEKRRQKMKSLKLRDDFYWTGIIDDQLRVFDIIMYTEFGTTYNSYVMKAGDKTVLFETAKAKFLTNIWNIFKEVIDIRKIDYLVVSHTEPDHAGSVERLLDYSPQMKVIATGCALGFLKEIVNQGFCRHSGKG